MLGGPGPLVRVPNLSEPAAKWMPIMDTLALFGCCAKFQLALSSQTALSLAMLTFAIVWSCSGLNAPEQALSARGGTHMLRWSWENGQSCRHFQSSPSSLYLGVSKYMCALHKCNLSFFHHSSKSYWSSNQLRWLIVLVPYPRVVVPNA